MSDDITIDAITERLSSNLNAKLGSVALVLNLVEIDNRSDDGDGGKKLFASIVGGWREDSKDAITGQAEGDTDFDFLLGTPKRADFHAIIEQVADKVFEDTIKSMKMISDYMDKYIN